MQLARSLCGPTNKGDGFGIAELRSKRGTSTHRSSRRAPTTRAAFLDFLRPPKGGGSERRAASSALLAAIVGTDRGLKTSSQQKKDIMSCVADLQRLGAEDETTRASLLSATWRLLWTTERETLWILQNAGLFGTSAGEVYQVIDVASSRLNNVITFPPEGAFVVDSGIEVAVGGPQRVGFTFDAARLLLPGGKEVGLPPFGKGWFDTVYCDRSLRVAKDSRGDVLVVVKDGPPRSFG
jgi:hypothetical protein